MGPVVSPLRRQYLYPQTHPANKAGMRNDQKGRGSSLESRNRRWTSAAPIYKQTNQNEKVTGEAGTRPPASLAWPDARLPCGAGQRAGAALTSCSESVPDSFLSLPLLPIPPFFRLLLPGFRPLQEGIVHLPRGLSPPLPPASHPQPQGPWPSPPGHWTLAPHLRGPLSPSMWFSSPSPCMSGTDATRSFKKSNCCSNSMHCFLEEGGRGWHSGGAQPSAPSARGSLDVRGMEPGKFQSPTIPPFARRLNPSSQLQTH